jgi:hypothetical protein
MDRLALRFLMLSKAIQGTLNLPEILMIVGVNIGVSS